MSQSEQPNNKLLINASTYDFCVKAFRTTKKLLKLNIELQRDESGSEDLISKGNIFLFNHFARFETFIPQYLIHEETGAYCRSIASAEFFGREDRFSRFLYSVGVIPNDLPQLFPFLAKEILHDRKLVIFPEGGMVKDKRVIDKNGHYSIFSRTANERRKHHRGPAVIALALDAFKTTLLHDFSIAKYDRIERWAEQLEFNTTEELMVKALQPTIIVPSHITFYPIRVNDNILHQSVQLFSNGIKKRFAEELLVEGNLLFRNTDMDIRFSNPITVGKYWRWWEKRLLPNAVHRFNSLGELFSLKPEKGHWAGAVYAHRIRARSNHVRDDYMRSMYESVTINLSHIASYLIMTLYQNGITRLRCARFHKILYICIKKLQTTEHHLHRSLKNPEEYSAIVSQGSTRLSQFLSTVESMKLLTVENKFYMLSDKLMHEFDIDEIRTENLISVYANEIASLSSVTKTIKATATEIDRLSPQQFADYRFSDQQLALIWDKKKFDQPNHDEINQQQTATEDSNCFFLKSNKASATGVLLVHGFLASPAEMRSLADYLLAQGHHVLGIRLKGHGTSPWDLRSRDWKEWLTSVENGYDVLKVFTQSVYIVGFSTGGLLALLHASNRNNRKIKGVISVSAPIDFKNKNLKFVPFLHHANRFASLITSEGVIPFQPNDPENPEVNYQHIPIRALYQLQQLVEHILENPLNINAQVSLFQSDNDPVVEPSSIDKLYDNINASSKTKASIRADLHGIVYRNVGQIHEKIAALIR